MTPASSSALDELVAALPEGAVLLDPDVTAGYRQDWAADPTAGHPAAVVRATCTEDIQTVMRWATAHRVPVVPRGAGSGLSGGSSAVDGCIVVSTERMRQITIDPVARVAVTQPGLMNAEVKKAAAEHGLWYPPDPSSFEICSIGGNAATNAGGLCCVKYGVTTDYVLGLRVVLADGTAVSLGGPLLKDVAGLSLTKLFVGSEGTLGIITEITLRLIPAQPPGSTVVASFDSVQEAADAVLAITSNMRPAMLEFMDHASINAVEDSVRMGLNRKAHALLLAQSDAPGAAGVLEIETIVQACENNGATEVFATDDQAEGDAFAAARASGVPRSARDGKSASRRRGRSHARTPPAGNRGRSHRRRPRRPDLHGGARRRRKHTPAHRLRPRRPGHVRTRTDRIRTGDGSRHRARRHDHRRTRGGSTQARLAAVTVGVKTSWPSIARSRMRSTRWGFSIPEPSLP